MVKEKTMKICVYTCITGNYDKVNEIKLKEPDIDYYLFTNNKKIKSKTWDVIYINSDTLDDAKLSREIKIIGHDIIRNGYDVSVWMDGNIIIEKSIHEFINTFMTDHSKRNSIAEEMEACIEHQKESIYNVERLREFYKQENFKDNTGLIECTVHVKKHNDPQVIETMKLWFDMVKGYSGRDQLSFNYAISKTGLKVTWINENVWDNEWFSNNNHIPSKHKENFKVYFETDGVFTEQNIKVGKYQINKNIYTAIFKNPTNSKTIRFDPTDLKGMKCSNLVIKGCGKYTIDYVNCLRLDNTIYFKNDDPFFIIHTSQKTEEIEISMILSKQTDKDIKSFMDLIDIQKDKIEFYEEREPNIQQSLARLKQIENSRGWKALEKCRRILKRNDSI